MKEKAVQRREVLHVTPGDKTPARILAISFAIATETCYGSANSGCNERNGASSAGAGPCANQHFGSGSNEDRDFR